MLKAIDVAKYFLNNDDGTMFNNIAQNLYIAQHGSKLFEDDLYAYDNGAVVPPVRENYLAIKSHYVGKPIPLDESAFLDKVYQALRNASLEELIDISHEDAEWERKRRRDGFYSKEDQKMDSLEHIDEYRKQYKDMLIILDRMGKNG